MKQPVIITFLLTGLLYAAHAQETAPIPLYTGNIPGSKPAPTDYVEQSDRQAAKMVTKPTLTPFFAPKEKATGVAVIVIPGGGYSNVVVGREGYRIAEKFNEAGITAFVLKYRLPDDRIMKDKSTGPLQDAQRAMQIVREHAAEWGLQADKIGIIGFSAGGHLASTAGTHFEQAVIDNPKHINLRPDFMMLLYPVISFGEYAHAGSRQRLLGENADSAHIQLYSNEMQVTANTPVTFIVHAQDDRTVPVQNSLLFYEALVKAGVKAEMHIYQNGGHGFDLHNQSTKDEWFDRCMNWMAANGLLKGEK
ncbi:alpha/beta hydrolase [Chitinophaga sp. CF418]|uniref:alpha/beta hydrolase n=1 Tax=Chitinophaga sp. CF418 TaxID=1855287 RepID=UPI00091845CD|nr:alpha/beta hydrolase [Chitinophaga sp. CF418]SHN36362.1 Acetyl esterase/lipase [Chitinophaga sp. CF418]